MNLLTISVVGYFTICATTPNVKFGLLVHVEYLYGIHYNEKV